MKEITHRQMRNDSADVLRRVSEGESLIVTNNGQPAAIINPASGDTLSMLEAQGSLRPARTPLRSLRTLPRRKATISTLEILSDVRGRW